jgi:hypothetical protein
LFDFGNVYYRVKNLFLVHRDSLLCIAELVAFTVPIRIIDIVGDHSTSTLHIPVSPSVATFSKLDENEIIMADTIFRFLSCGSTVTLSRIRFLVFGSTSSAASSSVLPEEKETVIVTGAGSATLVAALTVALAGGETSSAVAAADAVVYMNPFEVMEVFFSAHNFEIYLPPMPSFFLGYRLLLPPTSNRHEIGDPLVQSETNNEDATTGYFRLSFV